MIEHRPKLEENKLDQKVSPFIYFLRSHFPLLIFRQKNIILNFNNIEHIQWAADDLAEGFVIGAEMAGAKGLVADGTNEAALEEIFILKLRDEAHTLIIGGGQVTRERLIDKNRWPKVLQDLDPHNYDIPHFLEHPVKPLSLRIGKVNDELGRTGSIFWANYYIPLELLENAFLERKPEAFLAGSSANISGCPSIETTKDLFNTFTTGKHRVARILHDPIFEKLKPFHGTHTMLGYRGAKIVPLRAGSITSASFAPLYGNLLAIPEIWKEEPSAQYVDVNSVRAKQSYF